jgi:hypothetical protein
VAVVVLLRLRARRERAVPGRTVCVELQLGRDDQASPYEVSKVFDGLAGALRPGLIRRALRGPDTLTLRIVSQPGAQAVRFLIVAPARFHASIGARLAATYPDTKLIPINQADADPLALAALVSPATALKARLRRQPVAKVAVEVLRLKKARRWVWALATTKDYEHSPIESLLSVMHTLQAPCVVELLLTPAPAVLERYSGRAVHRRERSYIGEYALSGAEPGVESVVAQKHLKGAVEGVGRAWWWFDYRVLVACGLEDHARQVAGIAQETRAENYLRIRVMRARRRLYAWRSARGLPQLYPALWSGALSSAELASLWHLPTLRLKTVPLRRISAREIPASAAINRDPAHAILYDEHGPVGIHPQDRRKGLMLLGAAGAGKSTALATHVHGLAREDDRALIIIDPKEDFARQALGLIPTHRRVYYLDLGHPRYGLNILTCGQLSPEIRADTFISIIRELAGESAVGPRSDMFLRTAIQTAVTVEVAPALQHVAALLDLHDSGYRQWAIRELHYQPETDYLRGYWQNTFAQELKDNRRFLTEALGAPLNKLARFTGTPALSLLTTHPNQLDLQAIIQNQDVLIVNGSKGAVGEDNANLLCAMLIVTTQKTLHQQQRKNPHERPDVALVIDEAHNVFTPSFAKLLSEGRSARIAVTAAFQYTGQITDERVKSGIKSLLQNISIFRLREFEDARAAASLAMEVFSDNIKGEIEDQRRLRLDPMDIVNSPDYRAANLWLSNGHPQAAFTAYTRPSSDTSATELARQHHEREQRQRGLHPHDIGRYIESPLVRGIATPVIARYRTVHIDLTGWSEGPSPHEITRITVLLYPDEGNPLGFTAEPVDDTHRHYRVSLTDCQNSVSWLPAGRYRATILVQASSGAAASTWAHTLNAEREPLPHTIEITDEPSRPLLAGSSP